MKKRPQVREDLQGRYKTPGMPLAATLFLAAGGGVCLLAILGVVLAAIVSAQ